MSENNVIIKKLPSIVKSDSPEFTGTPTAPTAEAGTNTNQIATTAFVNTAIANIPTATGLEF